MERDINNDDFEIFLKQKVDQHKLYPSDKAWKGIYNSLHPRMKWFKIGGTLMILSTLFIVYQETSFFNSSNFFLKKSVLHNSTKPSEVTSLLTESNRKPTKSISGSFQTIPFQDLTVNAPEITGTGSVALNSLKGGLTIAGSNIEVVSNNQTGNTTSTSRSGSLVVGHNPKGYLLHNSNLLGFNYTVNVAIPSNMLKAVANQDEQTKGESNDLTMKPISAAVVGKTMSGEERVSVIGINWLQEMAAIKLTPQKKGKFNVQFYFSPTVSYRRLSDNQSATHSGILNALTTSRDINRYVDHNPAIGAELGSNILFAVTRNFTLKSGLQLNYSRYNVKAYRYSYEKASIALNTAGPVADTLSSYTAFRNFNGYSPKELQNQYLQVSVPVGAELKLAGNKRLQFSVAGTIQPTFLLFSDTYLLSTNYLNYTKEPSLIRKWNVHSSFEAFLSYKTGGLRWQVGPQFRYQLMSSFNDRYPIKEYLFEYGIKIGVSKTLR